MTDPINKTGCVALYAARIHYYANEIVKTHRLEGQPGFDDTPWEMPCERLAAEDLPQEPAERVVSRGRSTWIELDAC